MSRPRIVVIDTSPAVRQGLRYLLIQHGYTVLGHDRAATAAAYVSREQPDLVIVDLPVEDPDIGLNLVRALRRDPATAALPLLVWSTDPALATMLRHRGLEEVAAMSKFDDISALVVAVDRLAAPRGGQAPAGSDPSHPALP